MRILVVTSDPNPSSADDRANLPVRDLIEAGHEVIQIAPTSQRGRRSLGAGPGPLRRMLDRAKARPKTGSGFGLRAPSRWLESELTVRALAARARHRPDVAHVVLHPASLGVPVALAATGVPVVLDVVRPLFDTRASDRDPATALRRESLRMAARAARAIVVRSPGLAAHLEAHLGIRGVTVAAPRLDLDGLAPMAPEAAKAQLGLPPTARFFALVGPLEPRLALEPLMFAHRKVPGAGLLVAGRGPEEARIHAMAVATRPSSPVALLDDTPEVRRAALSAADVGLSLGVDRPGPESLWLAAFGRRQVAFDHPDLQRIEGWYPGEAAVLQCPAAEPEALLRTLKAALSTARSRGPLSSAGLAAARADLAAGDSAARWLSVYREVAPRVDGN